MTPPPRPLPTGSAPSFPGLSPTRAEQWLVLGELVTLRLPRRLSGGHLSVLEVQTPPGSGVPFLHTHAGAETFVVLDGTFELYGQTDGTKSVLPAPAGTVVHVPAYAPHGYANVGDTSGRLLLVLHGEHQMEEFFAAIGRPIDGPTQAPDADHPLDPAAVAEAMAVHGIVSIEPPPF